MKYDFVATSSPYDVDTKVCNKCVFWVYRCTFFIFTFLLKLFGIFDIYTTVQV